MPFSSLADEPTSRPSTPTASVPRATAYPGGWKTFPASWDALPEERLLARETLALVGEAIAELPERQHLVILMRDIEGWSAERGVRGARDQRGQPAGTAAPCPLEGPPRAWSPTSSRSGADVSSSAPHLPGADRGPHRLPRGRDAARGRARLEAHLELCEGCVTYVEQMRQTIRTVRALRAEEVEATVPDDLLEAFRAWKRGEPLPGT